MTEYLSGVTGSLLPGFLLASGWYFSCAGTGTLLLRKLLKKAHPSFFLSLFFGCGTLALASFLLTPFAPGWKWAFLIPSVSGVQAFARIRFRKADLLFLLPMIPVLILFGNMLMPPAGWDALVYQLTVPFRWARDGGFPVYPDLPYSGFPLLPQFLYRDMIGLSGVYAPQFFTFFIWVTVLFFFRTLLPGRKAFLPVLLLVCAPVMGQIGTGSYAEVYTAGFFLAGILCTASPLTAGILAGFAFAVKGTGFFAAGALFLLVLFRRKRFSLPKTLLLFAAGCLAALPFYLRPWILTGNPFYPYFAEWFSAGEESIRQTSLFHHAIGSGSFGVSSPWEFLLAPFLMALPGSSALYDGCWGAAIPGMAGLALLPCFRRKIPFCLLPGAFLYGTWLFLTPQARFLLPLAVLILFAGTRELSRLPDRLGKILSLLLISGAVFTILRTQQFRNALMGYRHFHEPVSTLYSRTGENLVPEADCLRRLPEEEKTLLLFEERTLYFPRNAVIATPFFQSRYFTPPDSITPETVLSVMEKAGAARLCFRTPENNPDLDRKHLNRCETFLNALKKLTAEGRLVPEISGNCLFLKRTEALKK